MDFNLESLGWLSGDGPSASIAASSRIRIARNLQDFPFPYRANPNIRTEILSLVKKSVEEEASLQIFEFVELEKISPLERQMLLEDHLVSPYFLQDIQGRGVFLHFPDSISIMVNEEDHLRLQCLMSGLNLEKAWDILTKVDDALEAKLPFAFHESWGYLTACPTNLGTGLRASILLHLPGLVFMQNIPHLIQSLNQMGLIVRGFYGEGTEAQGHFFQVANAFSIGPTEEELVAKVASITSQVIEQELEARERLKRERIKMIEDRIWRSFAILKSARIVNSAETMELLSMTRMGVQMGILPPVPFHILNEMIVMTRPANLQKKFGTEPDPIKRDILRADYLRSRLEKFN
jgi:protein arginine kinase